MTAIPREDTKSSLPVHVSIATIPSRIGDLQATLHSLLCGTKVPDKIYVVHPEYCVWEKSSYQIPSFLNDAEWHRGIIEHIVCEMDWGPSTKIMGVLQDLPKEAYLVIADDDVVYDEHFLEGLISAQSQSWDSSFSYHTYQADGLTIATGCDGLTFYAPNLDGVEEFVRTHVVGTPLLYHDDLWIAFFLFRQDVRIRQVRKPAGSNELIYTQVLPNDVLSGASEGQFARANIYREGIKRLRKEGGLTFPQWITIIGRGAFGRFATRIQSLIGRIRPK